MLHRRKEWRKSVEGLHHLTRAVAPESNELHTRESSVPTAMFYINLHNLIPRIIYTGDPEYLYPRCKICRVGEVMKLFML